MTKLLSARSCNVICCLCIVIALSIALGLVLTQPRTFLFCMNASFGFLNYLDGTSVARQWNAYADTPAADFFEPLREEEILIHHHIEATSGQIPEAFEGGVLFRIGPNPYYPARTNLHSFEGDAMVHTFKFNPQNNSISVNSAFMETPKLKIEKEYGQGILMSGLEDLLMATKQDVMELSVFERVVKFTKFLLGIIVDGSWLSPFNVYSLGEDDGITMVHCANTDVLHWDERLFAVCEGSVFFEFDLEPKSMEIESVGFTKINESWGDYPFLAHSQVDHFNDDNLIVVGHDFTKNNLLRVGVIDTDSNLLHKADIELNHAQMVHDMASTEHFIIIFDFNVWFELPEDSLFDHELFRFVNDSESKSRIGIIRKEEFAAGSDDVRWFEVDGAMVFHMANAWEDDDEIVLIGPRMDRFDLNSLLHHNTMTESEEGNTVIYEWRLNLKTGTVIEREGIETGGRPTEVEMPVMHPLFEGKKSQHIWFNLIDHSAEGHIASSYGIVKYDVKQRKIVGKIEYDRDGRRGSYEAMFVPNEREEADKVERDDDGYLVNVIWNKETKKSNIQIFDARTMNSEPVAYIELPYRIPGGFHSSFIYL